MANYRKIVPDDNPTIPNVNIYLDDDDLNIGSDKDSKKKTALLGSATAGVPNKVYQITSLAQAKKIFGSGELVDAIEMNWQPSNSQTAQGGNIYAQRVEDATAASLTAGAVTFTSILYGEIGNSTQIKAIPGLTTMFPTIEVSNAVTGYQKTYDNIGRIASINYKLNDPKNGSATMLVDKDKDGTAKNLIITINDTPEPVTPDTVKDSSSKSTATDSKDSKTVKDTGNSLEKKVLTFDLNNPKNNTMFTLLAALSKIPNLTVEWETTSSSQNIPANLLASFGTEMDITKPLEGIGSDLIVSYAGDLVNRLSTDEYVYATYDVSKELDLTKLAEGIYLTGGETKTAPISWVDKFENFNDTSDFYYLVPLTDSPTIHAEALAYASDQRSLNHKMKVFCGAGKGETAQQLMDRALDIRSANALVVGSSGSFTLQDGRVIDEPAYMVAAALAGIATSLPIGYSITNKSVGLVSLDQRFKTDDLNNLDGAGVITVRTQAQNGAQSDFVVTDDPTTLVSVASAHPVDKELALGELVDFMFTDLRNFLMSKYIGTPVDVYSAQVLKDAVDTFLYNHSQSEGYVASYDPNKIKVQIQGKQATIYFTMAPKQTLRDIDVYSTFVNLFESSDDNGNGTTAIDSNGNRIFGN